MSATAELIRDAWFCNLHREIHHGRIESWTMEHRCHLHPVYVEWNLERLSAHPVPERTM